MARRDVVPAERTQWTADPFWRRKLHNGYIYGRGTGGLINRCWPPKSRCSWKLSVAISNSAAAAILLSESDAEVGSTGIQWMLQHSYPKIDAEFALNEGGSIHRN